MDDTIFDMSEAAEFLRISKSVMYQMNARKILPTRYVGKKPVFLKSELLQKLKDGAFDAHMEGVKA